MKTAILGALICAFALPALAAKSNVPPRHKNVPTPEATATLNLNQLLSGDSVHCVYDSRNSILTLNRVLSLPSMPKHPVKTSLEIRWPEESFSKGTNEIMIKYQAKLMDAKSTNLITMTSNFRPLRTSEIAAGGSVFTKKKSSVALVSRMAAMKPWLDSELEVARSFDENGNLMTASEGLAFEAEELASKMANDVRMENEVPYAVGAVVKFQADAMKNPYICPKLTRK